jgi:glutamine synthetase
MRTADERPVAEGGEGADARPLLAAERGGFVEQHALWCQEQYAAASQLRRVIDEIGIERVRLAFVDQHGVLRGKTVTREALPGALRDGIRAPSSLLLKDTSGRTVFPVFTADVGVGVEGFSGAADVVLVPDPVTFRPLPWSPSSALMLCDLRFPSGERVPFCTRSILRRLLEDLLARGYALNVGVELEFHVFRAGRALEASSVSAPGEPGQAPGTSPTTRGAQLLNDDALDELDQLVSALHTGLTRLDLPLRSIEVEFGPSQLEVTLGERDALSAADDVVLCRAAIRQICRREGYCATFMSRPAGAKSASTGWHLHQSLCDPDSGRSVFMPQGSEGDSGPGYGVLSDIGGSYLAGLLTHAAAAAAFTTPTVNGYKRYQPDSLAPERIAWGIDNRGAMVRVIGGQDISGTRLENRSGEPGANPYLYVASQLISGLDGVDRKIDPGPPTDEPYLGGARRLPRSLGEALDGLADDALFEAVLGAQVVGWYAALKRAEFDRYLAHVSDWEQREYFAFL